MPDIRLGPILAATVVTEDLSRATRVYRAGLGMDVIEIGRLDPVMAEAWGAPDLSGAPWVVLGAGGDGLGALRFVEAPGPSCPPRPLASLGWAAAEISVIDVEARTEAMLAAGFRLLGRPRPLGSNPGILAAQLAGPDGEALYITDVRAYDGALDLRRARRTVDGCFIAVLAVEDLEAARAGYEDGFATRRVSDRRVEVPVLTASLGLPDGDMVRISSQQLREGCLIEVDAYPGGTPRRARVAGLPAGIALMSFAGPADGPPGPDCWPYRGQPTEVRMGAAGELFELIGHAG